MDELTEREFREIRDLIVANDRRVFEHLRHEHETQTARIGELAERLDHHNDFERRMADQAARFIMRPEFEDAKAAGVERYETNRRQFETKIEGELKPLRTAIDVAGKPNWTILATAFSIMVALCAGGWLVIGLKIDNTVAPVALSLEQAKAQGLQNADRLHFIEAEAAASTQQDTISTTDRAQINERVHQLESVLPTGATAVAELNNLKTQYGLMADRLQTIRTEQAKQAAALTEIETQFCAADSERNLMHAYDLRILAMLWHKTFAMVYPTDNAYYPRVGRCVLGSP